MKIEDAQLSLRVVAGLKPVPGSNPQPSVLKASMLTSTPRLHHIKGHLFSIKPIINVFGVCNCSGDFSCLVV